MIEITHQTIEHEKLLAFCRNHQCGAVVLFLGTVRDFSDGVPSQSLDYQAYEPMAKKCMEEICQKAKTQWNLGKIALVHRLGHLELGETSVAVCASSAHRAEAFQACQYVMEELKKHVPIWKKENRPDGKSNWTHPE